MPVWPLAREDKLADFRPGHCFQDGQSALCQWHAVFAAALHTGSGDRPDIFVSIDLGPSRTDHFTAARHSQDRKLQGNGSHGSTHAQARQERGNVAIGHCLMMAGRLDML